MEEKDIMEMRTQIALLKEKLNQQDIVNDRLIRASMRDKQQEINRQGWKTVICGIAAIPMWILVYISSNSGTHQVISISLGLCIATCLMMIFCIAATWYCHRPINKANLFTSDVKTVAEAFASVKHMYHIWLTYFTPALIIPWLLWVCHDYARNFEGNFVWAIYALVIFAAIIGLLIGYRWHRKVVNTCQEVIEQLS